MSEIRRDNRFLAAAFLALAALPAGFTRAADSPPRIVSLSPHITELLFAAGAGARVVGVDDSSDVPPARRRRSTSRGWCGCGRR